MKLDISNFLNKEISKKNLNITLKIGTFYDGNEYIDVLEPVKFSGVLKKVDNIITLTGKINTILGLTCSRCLEKFSYNVDISINENFTDRKIVNGDDDIIFIDDNCIDITEIIENNIILILPIKRLCKKDCKGLCPKCGINLNYSTCNCQNNEIDLRWEKLRNLFS